MPRKISGVFRDIGRPGVHPREITRDSVNVLHLDHSVAAGGAEMALLRMLEVGPTWSAAVLVPTTPTGDAGIFGSMEFHSRATFRQCGPAQSAGASKTQTLRSTFGFAFGMFAQAMAIRTSTEFRRSQVVDANSSRAAVYGAIACLGTRKALVVHLRDMVTPASLGPIGVWLFRLLAMRRAQALISNSQPTLESAQRYVRRKQVAVVIPSASGLDAATREPYIPNGEFIIGMVARLAYWKGQHLLLEAFAEHFKGKPAKLVIVGGAHFGEEAYAGMLDDRALELGISEQVTFTGHRSDTSNLIRDFDICVQASTRPEPMGQNILQYLSAGRATIASDRGGPSDWIKHSYNGLLFAQGDVVELGNAMKLLWTDTELRIKLANAAAATKGLLSDDEVSQLHANIFERISIGRAR